MTHEPGPLSDDVLDRVACASLVDAMGRTHGHRAHILSLVSPAPRRLFGPVATVAYLPYRDDVPHADFGDLFTQAMVGRAAGTVLVLSSGGYPDASHGGGTKLSRLENTGAAGVLTDGRLRDFDQLADYGFATWCAGEATMAGGGTAMPFAANVAVEVGGVSVFPGDYLYADASGAVVIPNGSLERVVDEALKVEAEDAGFAQEIAAEDGTSAPEP
ncbi:dimethylmenaquinone methyltransferase [Streptomyces camponoticapitis]|uniref:Putative 4-hydroxy-4-methyl-2-oxoglutarate aldolase n=1 Tax=Streptomyces camponoticapitis TaxID=1616125 RepID=A0ABQ2E838_9ACTN|nr:RraA family protein [Streptomyces camponoticapitis]GGK00194.1 dimethylmenaquinone methyltransferase [Streptomyces camponoticapitis]